MSFYICLVLVVLLADETKGLYKKLLLLYSVRTSIKGLLHMFFFNVMCYMLVKELISNEENIVGI